MFEIDIKRREARLAFWEKLLSMGRGDVFRHEDAEAALGLTRPNSLYYSAIDGLRVRLEKERGLTLVNVPLVGYEVASPLGQLESARRRRVKAMRQDRRGFQTVACLPVEDCNPIEAKAKFAMEEIFAAKVKQGRSESQLMSFLMRPRNRQSQ